MPRVDATALSGEAVSLPRQASKRPIVLVFGFSRSAKGEGEVWGKELLALQREKEDFEFFQVAPLSGAPRFTHRLIARAMRASVPASFYPHVILMKGSDQAWRSLLHVRDEGSAYLVLCSSSGEVQWQTRGAGQEQFAALRARL